MYERTIQMINTITKEPVLAADKAQITVFTDTFGIGDYNFPELVSTFDQKMRNRKIIDQETLKALTTQKVTIHFVNLETLFKTLSQNTKTTNERYLVREMAKAQLLPQYALAVTNKVTHSQKLVGITNKNMDLLTKQLVYEQSKHHYFKAKTWVKVAIFLQNLKQSTDHCQIIGSEKAADLYLTADDVALTYEE